jgi:DNA helicase-2/ATP-dependent DNA helicase PcrA
VPSTKCVAALASVIDQLDKEGLTGAPTQDWVSVRRRLERAGAPELAKVAEMARYLRLLRRGSAIEQALIVLWVSQGNYRGAEEALEQAILQDQIVDGHRERAVVSVMNMHQLKGREYDAVVLVEDQYNTFLAQDKNPPYAEARRLLLVSITRARHYVIILSNAGGDSLARLLNV